MRLQASVSMLASAITFAALAACAGGDTAKKAEVAADTTPATSPAAATAGGTLSSSLVPKDSISDRADRGRILGDSNAGLWVIMISDFQCPFCKQWHDEQFAAVMDQAAKHNVRLAFLNFPLSIHPNAMPAAEAAMCASVQGKFWPMHDGLFNTQKRWEDMSNPTSVFDSLATAAGVNMTTYRQCVSKHLTAPLIEADRERARQAGARSTPTFFVGSELLEGADKNIRATIDTVLAKTAGAKKPAS